ncbi:MAG TPA: hypothetical protein PLT47_12095, partial [Bacteroidales bacterium]|nr:hypothetical protein [Bacteroidales bacterium]
MKTFKIIAFVMIVSVAAMAIKSIVPAFQHVKSVGEMVSVNDDYSKLWAKADSLVNKGLTRSAIEVV